MKDDGREPLRLPPARMARPLRRRQPRRIRRPCRPPHGMLLRPPRPRTGRRLGLQTRRRSQAPLSGQPLGADPRTHLQAGGGRGRLQQGAGDHHARQPRRPRPPRNSHRRRADSRARTIPCDLLAWSHLRPCRSTSTEFGLRRHPATETGARAEADSRAASAVGDRAP